MKKLVMALIIIVAMAIPLASFAGVISGDTTYNQGGDGGTAIGINKNTNINGNLNSNKNTNLNTNLNSNKNTNIMGQGQAQGQLQGQSQSANNSQTQSANNEGVVQTNNYEADKREFLNAPPVPAVDPKLSSGKAGAIRTKGSLWDVMTSIKKEQADKVLKGAGLGTLLGPDAKVEVRAVTEKDFQTDVIRLENKAPAGAEYLATIYVYSEGADSMALEAIAIRESMKLGGTHIVFIERDHYVSSSGKAWSIGVGGGASMMTRGDDVGIAPSGGLGISGAKASNESLPQLLFTVYCDAKLLKK